MFLPLSRGSGDWFVFSLRYSVSSFCDSKVGAIRAEFCINKRREKMNRKEVRQAIRNRQTVVWHYTGHRWPLLGIGGFVRAVRMWPLQYRVLEPIDAQDCDEAFRLTQDWEGGRSTSPGDILLTPDWKWWLCLPVGWADVSDMAGLPLRRQSEWLSHSPLSRLT